MKCRVCDLQMKLFDTLDNIAVDVSRLYLESNLSEGASINLFHCPRCNHYQISYINSKNYYDDYCLMPTSLSPKMQALQKQQIENLTTMANEPVNFIEIGCGDGDFLLESQKNFKYAIGIEPSKALYDVCKSKNLNVVNAYFNHRLELPIKFDVFAAREVFEHLINPLESLKLLYEISNQDAVGLIEVPNAQKTIGESRYYEVYSDHVNYFTPLSLCYMAQNAGFEVIRVTETLNGDYLELYMRKRLSSKVLKIKRERDISFIMENVSKFKIVSAWGAGFKAQAILCGLKGMSHQLELKYIFDSDLNKKGKYLGNSSTVIVNPTIEAVNENDLIIILTITYEDEILEMLKHVYKYEGFVLSMQEEPRIFKLSK